MQYVHHNGAAIAWERHGSGTPLLLIMGHVFGRRMWDHLVPPLAAHHEVLTFDHRGVGDSTWDGNQFEIGTLADDAVAVLDAAGVERAHVFGVSMGGLVAQEVALARPDRTSSLIVGCSGAPAPGTVEQVRFVWLRYHLPRGPLGGLLARQAAGPNADPALLSHDAEVLRTTPAEPGALIEQHHAIRRYHSRDRVSSLRLPTLVLHGDADRVVDVERGRELADLVPGATYVELAGAGHNFVTSAFDATVDAIRRFLEQVDNDRRRTGVGG